MSNSTTPETQVAELENPNGPAALAEFVHLLTLANVKAKLHRIPGLPNAVICEQAGEMRQFDLDPPRRLHRLYTLSSFLAAVLNDVVCPNPEVYIGRHRAVAYCDRDKRTEAVAFHFDNSARFRELEEMEHEPKSFTVKECMRFLRFELHGAVAQELVAKLSRLDFSRTDSGSSHASHGAEGCGRSIEQEAQGASEIPTSFAVEVPVFLAPGAEAKSKQKVEVGVFLDLEAGQIELRTLSDECRKAEQRAALAVGATMEGKLAEVPFFYGDPYPNQEDPGHE